MLFEHTESHQRDPAINGAVRHCSAVHVLNPVQFERVTGVQVRVLLPEIFVADHLECTRI